MQVPLDSEVVHGRSLVSMEHITGESLPAPRGLGDELPAGARNHDGALVVRALRASSQSTPARIARLTLDAQVSSLQCFRANWLHAHWTSTGDRTQQGGKTAAGCRQWRAAKRRLTVGACKHNSSADSPTHNEVLPP